MAIVDVAEVVKVVFAFIVGVVCAALPGLFPPGGCMNAAVGMGMVVP